MKRLRDHPEKASVKVAYIVVCNAERIPVARRRDLRAGDEVVEEG